MTLPAVNLDKVPQMTDAQAKACKDTGGRTAYNAKLSAEQESELDAVIAAACEELRRQKDAILAEACEYHTGYVRYDQRCHIRKYQQSSRRGELKFEVN